MLFSSIIFIFYFLPLTLIFHYVIPERFMWARNGVLLIASLIFYSWGEPVYVFLMIYSAIFNWFMGHQIAAERRRLRSRGRGGMDIKAGSSGKDGNARTAGRAGNVGNAGNDGKAGRGGKAGRFLLDGKRNLIFAVIVNVFILGFFKYFGFLMDTFNSITGSDVKYTALALPIGISFYTFQALSYIIDVYRGKVEPQRNILDFALYLAFFPQLIAGPIIKYHDIETQLRNRTFSTTKFGEGAVRFVFGLGKKVILANNLGAVYTMVSAYPDEKVSVLTYWIGIIAYTMQIYFDFSGYSDMAIGLGRMMGFKFAENFNYPYISKSVTDFWRRWHMSLSGWFREYVYIPLGGNRVTVPRHILNLLIVWGLTGFWHGASWNFILWGLYYGVLLIIEKYLIGRYLEKWPKWIQHFYTMLIVVIGWTLFSITDFSRMAGYLATMFGAGGHAFANMETLYILRTNLIFLVGGIICCGPGMMNSYRKLCETGRAGKIIGLLIMIGILMISVAYLVYGSYNPFLYFRF